MIGRRSAGSHRSSVRDSIYSQRMIAPSSLFLETMSARDPGKRVKELLSNGMPGSADTAEDGASLEGEAVGCETTEEVRVGRGTVEEGIEIAVKLS
jgi:hypothetical protein